MKTKITFAHEVTYATTAQIAAVIVAAGITLTISSLEISHNIITITADRHLTSIEKTALRTEFYAMYPIVDDL